MMPVCQACLPTRLMQAACRAGLLALAAAPLLLNAASPAPAPAGKAAIGAWGFDLTGRNTAVKPGDDFFDFANGGWLARTRIPADRAAWGSFDTLADEAEQHLHQIVQAIPADAARGSNEQKVGDTYRAYLDTARIEQLGLGPAQPALAQIAAATSHADIARLMGRPDVATRSPIGVGVTMDQKNPDRYVVTVSQAGLGLPERDYYLKDDAKLAEVRANYEAHIARMLALAGQDDAPQRARDILALETKIAEIHWPAAKRRERDLTYNLRTRAELDALAPAFPWPALLGALGVDGQKEYVVRELDAVQGLGKLFAEVPVETWRSYVAYHYLASMAPVLPSAFDDEYFDFYGRVLSGQPQQRERWKRAIGAVNANVGEALGQMYVARYFPPEAKVAMTELVENLRKAYAARVKELPWMTEATKKVALEKLAAFRPKIGYPDQWRDYSGLEVRGDDAFGNSVRATEFEWNRQVNRLNKPTDREEWRINPQTVNAYYNSTFNEIVFPAAILQAPFFDLHADPAVNYGGIGGVIGHEMGHGFDDQGSKSDARGILRTWWAPEDEQAFRKLVDSLAVQYDAYEALPSLNVNGRLTLGENIGDLGGLSVALEAYRLSLEGKPAPVLDDLTGEQRFFLGWAQVWRNVMRDERLRSRLLSDPHSPPRFRVNGVVRNIDDWYEAFGVQPGDRLYLPPGERVHIW